MDTKLANLLLASSHDIKAPLANLEGIFTAYREGLLDDPDTLSHFLFQGESQLKLVDFYWHNITVLAKWEKGHLSYRPQNISSTDLLKKSHEIIPLTPSISLPIHKTQSITVDRDLMALAWANLIYLAQKIPQKLVLRQTDLPWYWVLAEEQEIKLASGELLLEVAGIIYDLARKA